MNQAFINRYALLLKLAKNDFDFTLKNQGKEPILCPKKA